MACALSVCRAKVSSNSIARRCWGGGMVSRQKVASPASASLRRQVLRTMVLRLCGSLRKLWTSLPPVSVLPWTLRRAPSEVDALQGAEGRLDPAEIFITAHGLLGAHALRRNGCAERVTSPHVVVWGGGVRPFPNPPESNTQNPKFRAIWRNFDTVPPVTGRMRLPFPSRRLLFADDDRALAFQLRPELLFPFSFIDVLIFCYQI